MNEDLILAGASGCMRELLWQIEELNQREPRWNVLGYVDKDPGTAVEVGGQEYPYLGDDDFLLHRQEAVSVAICVGSPKLRRKIAEKLAGNPLLRFPNLILSGALVCADVQMGKGNIISMDCRISTNVRMGDFNFLNLGAGICHDGMLGDDVTLGPDVRLAGNVTVGSGCDIGMGARVIQGIRIGAGSVVGAGGVVVRDLPENSKAVGVPARQMP